MTERGNRANPARIMLLLGAMALWSLLILVRLAELQIVRHREFLEAAQQHQEITQSVVAPRGIIYDSRMDELATNVKVSTVAAEPPRMKDLPRAARSLASILKLDYSKLLSRMMAPGRKFMIVKRRIDPRDEERIEALDMDGVYLIDESMRVYPNRELACHVLGFVNMNGDGGAGLEFEYDRELKGRQGEYSLDVDAHRRSFRARVEIPPVQGHSLILSLDKSIQYIAERELAAGVKQAHAASGTAIVMDSETGRILAMAVVPNFNCNAYNKYPAEFWSNRAVSDFFEPGSTFKVVVATAALEAGLTRPDEPIDCQMGSITIGRHVFHDHKPYGILTFTEILEHSSNVGAAKLGLRLGEQQLYEALRSFGFGSKTGIDLPGEIVGLVRDWRRWSGLSVGAISFGQEVGVTSMQILTAINAIANGGYRVKPSLVDRVVDDKGDLVHVRSPERTRIMRPLTAAAVRKAFEGVVLRGTGRKAALEGYRAAGKTGTAQKIVDGRYSDTKYVASFIGFAPLPRPRISVLVQIDEPAGSIYGGDVAGPIFSRIAQEALLQLRVPPDNTLPMQNVNPAVASTPEDFGPDTTPAQPLSARTQSPPRGPEDGIAWTVSSVEVPDFHGLSKRIVIERCAELGIKVRLNGSGTAVFQSPAPGSAMPDGDVCSVTFARGAYGSDRNPSSVAQQNGPSHRATGNRP